MLLKHHYLEVDLRHVGLFNEDLAHSIQERPGDILPLVSAICPSYLNLLIKQTL
jgi:DNA replication licensing factor MCM5